MKSAVKVFSIISIVIGGFAFLGGLGDMSVDPQAAGYALVGGALFLTQGILSLIYIGKSRK